MSARACEAPEHEGERLMAHPMDAFELRLEARRFSDQGRERVRILMRVCRACLPHYFDRARPDAEQEVFAL